MRFLIVASVALAAAACQPSIASAHDIWTVIEPQGAQSVAWVRFGDPSELETADVHKIVSVELVSPSGRGSLKRPLTAAKQEKPGLRTQPFAAPKEAILTVTYDNGYFAVDPADKKESNTSKLLLPNAAQSWWAPKFGKTLLGPGSYKLTANALLEITPLEDPYQMPVGQALKVRLLYAGKPIPNVDVTYTDGLAPVPEKSRPAVKTDAAGVATIPFSRRGPYLLTADYLAPASHPDLSDQDELYATLAFDTAQ